MRIIEMIYDEYKKAISNKEEEKSISDIEFKVTKDEINKILDMAEKTESKKIEVKEEIEVGNVYEYFDENLPIIFTILEKENDIYIALVLTLYWELASDRALIVNFDHPLSKKFAVLPIALNLDKDFIKNETVYVGKLKKEDIQILQKFYNGEREELPPNKRGLSYPEGENYIQEKFLKDEIKRTFKLQAFVKTPEFWEEDAIIELPPERLVEQPLAAGEEKTVYRGENFILFYNKEKKEIELKPFDDLVEKSIAIKVFNEEFGFRNLPAEVKLKIPEDYKGGINIDYIGKNIELKEIRL